MCLIDTHVISKARKGKRAHSGVIDFFIEADQKQHPLYLSAITVGDPRRGVEFIQHRGDTAQAGKLEVWLEEVLGDFSDNILEFGEPEAQLWGRLRVPSYENILDK